MLWKAQKMTNSLREALEKAFDNHDEKIEDTVEKPIVEEAGATEEAEDENDIQDIAASSAEADESSKADEESQISKVPEAEAPDHWSIRDKEMFNKQDGEGKEFLLRRHKEMEASFTKKSQNLSEEMKFLKTFKDKLTPFEPYLRQNNIDPLNAFENLLATEMKLRNSSPEEKANLLRQLALDYGAQYNPQDPDQPIDYQQQAYANELYSIKETLKRIEQDKINSEQNYYQKTIESFSSSKDENGKPKHPYFEDVKSDMAMLLSAGRAETLEEAYNQSIFLNPSLRNDIIVRQSNNERRIADKKVKNEAAKRAGFNIKSSGTASMIDQPKELDLRGALSQIYDDYSQGDSL
jgi:hypothetical protein